MLSATPASESSRGNPLLFISEGNLCQQNTQNKVEMADKKINGNGKNIIKIKLKIAGII